MYETKISDARWIAYDIPGNIGWIAYIVTVIIALTNDPDVLSCCSIIPAVLMLMGVAELISERIARLDRILPKARLKTQTWRRKTQATKPAGLQCSPPRSCRLPCSGRTGSLAGGGPWGREDSDTTERRKNRHLLWVSELSSDQQQENRPHERLVWGLPWRSSG